MLFDANLLEKVPLSEIYDLKAGTTVHRVWQVEANLAPMPDITDVERWGSTENTALRWLFFAFALNSCRRVLDVGCGDGRPSLYIAPFLDEVIGVDISPAQIVLAQKSAELLGCTNVCFAVADIAELPFADAEFDGVCFGGNVLTYGNDQTPLLREIHRVLKPGGIFAFEQWPSLGNQPTGDTIGWFIDSASPILHVSASSGPYSRDLFVFLHPDTPQGRRITELGKEMIGLLSREQRLACEEIKAEIEHGYIEIVQRAIYAGEDRSITREELLPLLEAAGFTQFACYALPDPHAFARELAVDGLLTTLRQDDLLPLLRALVASSPKVRSWEFNNVICRKTQ